MPARRRVGRVRGNAGCYLGSQAADSLPASPGLPSSPTDLKHGLGSGSGSSAGSHGDRARRAAGGGGQGGGPQAANGGVDGHAARRPGTSALHGAFRGPLGAQSRGGGHGRKGVCTGEAPGPRHLPTNARNAAEEGWIGSNPEPAT